MLFFRAKVRACNPTRTSTTKSAFFAAGFAAECLRRCRGLPRWVTPTNHLKNGLFSPFASMGCVVSLRRGSPGAFPPYPPPIAQKWVCKPRGAFVVFPTTAKKKSSLRAFLLNWRYAACIRPGNFARKGIGNCLERISRDIL